jgi:CubicO group peptidase (beta-lactamase class C family)
MTRDRIEIPPIHGTVEPDFNDVRQTFIENFMIRGEIGAACTIFHRGEKVVDLWGGYRERETQSHWEENTLVLVFSATKGVAAMTMEVAHSRHLFEFDDLVSSHWPEFSQNGKGSITIRQLISHQAGLSAIDEPLTLAILADHKVLADILARQKPAWIPGTRQGYHGITLGWYESELLRRVDPLHRGIGQFFSEEIAKPLNIEFYIGTPETIPDSRFASIYAFTGPEMLLHLDSIPMRMVLSYMVPGSLTKRSMQNPKISSPSDFNTPAWRAVEFPSGGGIGQVRSLARCYSAFSTGGKELGITPETLSALSAPAIPPSRGIRDVIVQVDTSFALGFMKPSTTFQFGSNEQAFGTPGVGGAFGYADPVAQVGYAYAPNRVGFSIWDDPRDRALRQALSRCLRKINV